MAAGVRHALDDEALIRTREPGDVHLDAVDQAQAARPMVGRVRRCDRFGEAGRIDRELLAADQVRELRRRMDSSRSTPLACCGPQRTGAARSRLRCTSGVGTTTGRCEGAALS